MKITISLRKSNFKFSKLNLPIIFSYALDDADYGKNKKKFLKIILAMQKLISKFAFFGIFTEIAIQESETLFAFILWFKPDKK